MLGVLKALYAEGWDCISVVHSNADPETKSSMYFEKCIENPVEKLSMFYINFVGTNILRIDQAPEKVILLITSFFALERLSFQISEVPEREKTLEFAFEGNPWSSRTKEAVEKTNSILCGLVTALQRKKFFVYASINTGFGRVFDPLQVRHRHISQEMHPVVSDTLVFSNHQRSSSKKLELMTFSRNKQISFFYMNPSTLNFDKNVIIDIDNGKKDLILTYKPWTMSIEPVQSLLEVQIFNILNKMYENGWKIIATFIPSIYHVNDFNSLTPIA